MKEMRYLKLLKLDSRDEGTITFFVLRTQRKLENIFRTVVLADR